MYLLPSHYYIIMKWDNNSIEESLSNLESMAHTILLNQQQLLHLLTSIFRCYMYLLQHLTHISHVDTYILDTYMYISDTYVSDTYISRHIHLHLHLPSGNRKLMMIFSFNHYFYLTTTCQLMILHHYHAPPISFPTSLDPPLSLDPPTSLNPPPLPFLGYSLYHFLLRSQTVLNILFHKQVLT